MHENHVALVQCCRLQDYVTGEAWKLLMKFVGDSEVPTSPSAPCTVLHYCRTLIFWMCKTFTLMLFHRGLNTMHTWCLLSRHDTFEPSNDSFRNICDLVYNPYDTERLHFFFHFFFQ
jgi:hypothetical protein